MATSDDGRRRAWRSRLNDKEAPEVSTPSHATEKQIRRRGRVSLVLAIVIGAAALSATSFADNVIADGDGITPVANNNMAAGNVDCGVATNRTALVAVSRNGNYATSNVFLKGSTVTVSVQSVTGGGLSATMGAAATIAIPDDWDEANNNELTPAVVSTVTINSSAPGAGAGTVTYRATGTKSDGTTGFFREDTMDVSWTVLNNCAPPPPSDTTPPVITPNISGTLGNNGWYVSDVTVSWSVVDNESAVSSSTGCDPTTITSDTDGTSLTCQATSAGGTASNSVTIKRDATDPTLTPTVTPNPVTLNGSATASANAADATEPGSGLFSSSCDPVDTSSVGSHTVTCYAEDNAGNTNSASATYSVVYGICVLYDPSKSHKAGSTVPIKLYLCDANGVNVSSASVQIRATSLERVDNNASGVLEDSGSANSPDNNFRYDAGLDGGDGGYIFNLSTKSPSPALGQKSVLGSGTWKLRFTVDGVAGYAVMFDVR